MKFSLFVGVASLFVAMAFAPSRSHAQANASTQLSQEQLQILQQIVQQMTPEQRETLKGLPPEQQKAVLLQLLQRVVPAKPEEQGIKEFIGAEANPTITFLKRERYEDTSERIEEFIYNEAKRHVEVVSIAFVRDGHDHFLKYKRQYRAKYKTKSDGKEYVADFILEKEGAYMQVKDWRRVDQADS